MSYIVPSTPPPYRGRAYSFSQSAYPATPYSPYNSLPMPYYNSPGIPRNPTYYIAPSTTGRSRSHSRPRHSHHRSHHGHHHGHHHRRSHSAVSGRHHRSTTHHNSYRYPTTGTYAQNPFNRSPSLGERILNFFGLGNSKDQYGRSVDGRGRSKHKY
ncbi:hypothetical protein F5148DRAFT_1147563 [Russula earlei]|uniref:Uncharacterized protein n=1 Tax=Russula earlei TaxID=71964 RepID=A0ACC0UHZ2_9AGAM|nr:hypothetical protein F5148DRAFT_1147563 [Russula earlei]